MIHSIVEKSFNLIIQVTDNHDAVEDMCDHLYLIVTKYVKCHNTLWLWHWWKLSHQKLSFKISFFV